MPNILFLFQFASAPSGAKESTTYSGVSLLLVLSIVLFDRQI